MAQRVKPYRRLPGRARENFGLFKHGKQQLWQASDHLLVAEVRNYSARYKRFYLKDIQALTLCRNNAGRILNIGLLLLSVFFLLPAALIPSPEDGVWASGLGVLRVMLAGFSGAFLLSALINTLLGPTCTCHLYTAVQVERLTALGRLRTAKRTLNLLKWSVEEVQGRVVPDGVEEPLARDWAELDNA